MEITEEQIKEAHNAACSQWKQKIEQWFPECFKQNFELNKWYKDGKTLVFINKPLEQSGVIGYGFFSHGIWTNDWYYKHGLDKFRLATTEEVESMLIKEAEKRGYKEGDIVISAKDGNKYSLNYHPFIFEYGELRLGGICIMSNGKWATIVETPKEMTLEEIEKQLGHKVKIVS